MLAQPGVLEKFFGAAKNNRALSHHPCFAMPYTPELASALAKFLDSPDRKLQVLAISSLGEWGLKGPEGVPVAIKLLGKLEESDDVRIVAMSLGSFGHLRRADPRAVAAARRLLDERRDRPGAENLCNLLGKAAPSPEVTAALMKMAGKGQDHKLRRSAIKGLGSLKAAQALELLIGIMGETADGDDPQAKAYHRWLKTGAAEALGKIGDRRAVEPLLRMLKQGEVGRGVIDALAEIGDKRAVPELLRALKEAPKGHSTGLVSALAKIGDERAVPGLLKVLRKGRKFDRRWTASALRNSSLAARPEVAAALEEYRRVNATTHSKPKPQPEPEPPEVF